MRGRAIVSKLFAVVLFISATFFSSSTFALSPCAKALIASFHTRSADHRPRLLDIANDSRIQALQKEVQEADLVLVLADHDGTFKEHEANSELVRPTAEERALLQKYEQHPRLKFFFITGRPMDWFLERYGSHRGLGISANHGIVEKPIQNEEFMPLHGLPEDWREALTHLETAARKIPSSRIEHKLGYVFHWKESENFDLQIAARSDELARELFKTLNAHFQNRPVRFAWSDKGKYFEILPDDPRVGKGEAALRILRKFLGEDLSAPLKTLVITAGDESSDNEMHSVVRELQQNSDLKTLSIKVGENHLDQSSAEFWVPTPKDFQTLLENLLL